MRTFDFYEDAGHGWLRVPVRILDELGIVDDISSFSYIRGTFAYLEEDSDLTKFIQAWEAKHGKLERFREHISDRSKIRNYDSYSPEKARSAMMSPEERKAAFDAEYERRHGMKEARVMIEKDSNTAVRRLMAGSKTRDAVLVCEEQTLSCSSCKNYDVKAGKCSVYGAASKAHGSRSVLRWVANPNIGNDCSKYSGIEDEYYKGDVRKAGADKQVAGDPQGIIHKGMAR